MCGAMKIEGHESMSADVVTSLSGPGVPSA